MAANKQAALEAFDRQEKQQSVIRGSKQGVHRFSVEFDVHTCRFIDQPPLKEKMVGSLGDLYGSIEKLSDTCIQPNQNKNSILRKKSACFAADSSTLLISNEPTETSTVQQKYYRCSRSNSHYGVTNTMGTLCPSCHYQMNREVTFVESTGTGTSNAAASETTGGGGGYVKGVVMDNLVVMPMSTISSITLLNQFKIQDVGTLEEKVVYLSMDKGLELLNASLQSKAVLTDVFMSKKQVK